MDPVGRNRLRAWLALYSALVLGWSGFARWVVPPLLVADRPGPLIESLKRYLKAPPVPFLCQDLLGRWREFSVAVLIAMALHLTIVLILDRYDRRAAGGGSSTDARAGRRISLALAMIGLVFLAATILWGVHQDYYFYLQIWYVVRLGQDPWFIVLGNNGEAPLNAYGPLFNLLAGLSWINPLAPKLLFAATYILLSISLTKDFTAGRPPSGLRALGLIALFWNPFPWIEVAYYGHLDVLVGLACLGAARAWVRRREIRSAVYLAAGVLLKYLPIVVVPFLAADRGRRRSRFLAAALALIVGGLQASCLVWGYSTLRPLSLAATRASEGMSFVYFLRGPYSPLPWIGVRMPIDPLIPVFLLLALGRAWWWARTRKPPVEASALVAVWILVLLYPVGFPQYHMVPFVLGSAWLLRRWDRLWNRTAPTVAMACYFGWVTVFDVAYMLYESWNIDSAWARLQLVAGLPAFLFGCAFLGCVVRASAPDHPEPADEPGSAEVPNP